MRTRTTLVLVALPLAGLAGLAALSPVPQTETAAKGAAETFSVDQVHSTIIFRINHLGVSEFYGRINSPFGEFTLNPEDPGASSFNVQVKAQNVDTGSSRRDGHLKSADFFNAKQFPDITFKSKSVKKKSGNVYQVTGELTLHGVTKPITVDLEHIGTKNTRMGRRSGFHTTFSISRSEFGINYMPQGLGDEITIMIGIEGQKK